MTVQELIGLLSRVPNQQSEVRMHIGQDDDCDAVALAISNVCTEDESWEASPLCVALDPDSQSIWISTLADRYNFTTYCVDDDIEPIADDTLETGDC